MKKASRSTPKNRSSKKNSKNESKAEATIEAKRSRIVHCIHSLPKGRVSTYGAIARAAGWTGAARQVARVLRQVNGLPWHRVVGSGGAIKCIGEYAAEQRFRLQMEGVSFRGLRVNMKVHEHKFPVSRASGSRVSSSRTSRT
ncbi:MAG TPA: MGMT family protein [Terriglobales bacterium]|nr:MGMT family protein [Terriglobales bacterium]